MSGPQSVAFYKLFRCLVYFASIVNTSYYIEPVFALQIRMRQQEVQLQQKLLLKDAKLKAAGVSDGLKLLGLSKQQPPSAFEISQSMNKQVKQSLSLTVSLCACVTEDSQNFELY